MLYRCIDDEVSALSWRRLLTIGVFALLVPYERDMHGHILPKVTKILFVVVTVVVMVVPVAVAVGVN